MSSKSPPTSLGQYLILEELGAGSFARVYRCEHMFTHQKFAGKLYDVDFAISEMGCKMLRKEISILKLLRHPHVIRFQEVVSNRSWMLIVMELVEGRTLLNVMPPSGGLPESFARPIMKQILDAVAFLHCNGIVHRDIKLENIMIQNNGSIKVIDFGLADPVPQEEAKEGLLIDGLCGSPHYYSPEMVLARERDMFRGDKVDIWAMGILLYSLVTGYHPFSAENSEKDTLFRQIVSSEVPFDNDISKELESLLKKILVKDPSKRVTLHEICNHPWTNNTFLAHEAEDWISGREAEKHYSGPTISSLSFQDNCLDRTADADLLASFEHKGPSMRTALTPPTVTASNHSINSDRKNRSKAENYKSQRRKKKPSSTKERKTSTVSSLGFESKLWKRMKEGLKELVRNCKKRGSSDEEQTSASEGLNSGIRTSHGDYNRTRATGNTASSSTFVSRLSLQGRNADLEKKHSQSARRMFKMSFACWVNV